MKRLYEDGDTAIYYIMAENENYAHPPMPDPSVQEGIIRGMYKFRERKADNEQHAVTLFGSGAILNSALKHKRSWPSSSISPAMYGA